MQDALYSMPDVVRSRQVPEFGHPKSKVLLAEAALAHTRSLQPRVVAELEFLDSRRTFPHGTANVNPFGVVVGCSLGSANKGPDVW